MSGPEIYDREDLAEVRRIERSAVRVRLWMWRVIAVVLLAALTWTAFHSEAKTDVPHYPTHTDQGQKLVTEITR